MFFNWRYLFLDYDYLCGLNGFAVSLPLLDSLGIKALWLIDIFFILYLWDSLPPKPPGIV